MFNNYKRLAPFLNLSGQPVSGFAPIQHFSHRDRHAETGQKISDERPRPHRKPAHDVVARDRNLAAGPRGALAGYRLADVLAKAVAAKSS